LGHQCDPHDTEAAYLGGVLLLDLRHFIHHGVQHQQAEELENRSALGDWMKARGLLERGTVLSQKMLEGALQLRPARFDAPTGLSAIVAELYDARRTARSTG
jgi:hypothetical protein